MQDNVLTLGSLFDGVAGFPLAGAMCGIKTLWSSEIEPFCLKVTATRFPDVKQLGSVTEIDGGAVEPVDIITFGSPCQDLSVAGKQLGIHEGQRSNLFFEAVRIIKEMRKSDEVRGRTGKSIRPRFAVWENVPGAFSSNKGADFKAVLEALARVIEADISIPQPKRWDTGGGIVGNGWSLAWRVYDAQYWGVPQRRKRIYLVADFAGERAGEILFVTQSVRGHSSQGGEAREGAAADAERGAGGSGGVRCLNPWDSQSIRQYDINGVAPNINANNRGGQNRWGVCYAIQGNMVDRDTNQNGPGYMVDDCPTLNTVDKHAVAFQASGDRDNPGISVSDMAYCLAANPMSDRGQAVCFQQNQRDEVRDMGEQAGALTAQSGVHNQNYLCYPETARTLAARHDSSPCVDRGQNVVAIDCRNMVGNEELSATLQAKNDGGFSLNFINPICYRNGGYGDMVEGIGTLRADVGDAGPGSENIVVEKHE